MRTVLSKPQNYHAMRSFALFLFSTYTEWWYFFRSVVLETINFKVSGHVNI